ncbi:MAG: MBL fold metallo-hydrolase [Polyangiaceae bacterium]
MRASARYVDGAFRNTSAVSPGLRPGTTWSTIGEFIAGGKQRTPSRPLPALDPRPHWAHPAETGLRLTWLGHSTTLIEIDGARVLTDPVWSLRASPFSFSGPKRFQPVPVPIEALPPLDAVVISHDHYDHLDFMSVRALAKTGVTFYTALGVGAHLESWGIESERIVELDWWESVKLPRAELRLTATPSQHFSGRGLADRNATLWAGFALEGADHSVFFSGDTGLTEEYGAIAERFGAFDVVMLEVGAFHEAWGEIHLGPDNAITAFEMLKSARLMPVHWGTFNLALHAWDEPIERLLNRASDADVTLFAPPIGAAQEPARSFTTPTWWREPSVGWQPYPGIAPAR